MQPVNCVLHKGGWCATSKNHQPREGDNNVPTRCKHFIVLPYRFEKRLPDCPVCLKAVKKSYQSRRSREVERSM